jgi:hypothetical protein
VGDLAVAENWRMLSFNTHMRYFVQFQVARNPAVRETEPAVRTFMDLSGPPVSSARLP